MEGIIIKDDTRYEHTECYLQKRGYVFHKEDANPGDLDFVIFPLLHSVDAAQYDDEYFKRLRVNTIIFSGTRNNYIKERCTANGIAYYAMLEDEGVAIRNAIPTSEGVIAYLITSRDFTVFGSDILVMGYGICGRDLTKRLKALGANVFTLVRDNVKASRAYSDGIIPIFMEELNKYTFDTVINTIPNQILTDEMLEGLGGALMIDIASKPYGFNMEHAKKINGKSALLSGIPGKYAARYAGQVLGEYIYKKIRGV